MQRLKWLCVPLMTLCLMGCTQAGPEKIGLSGMVTYNGDPIEDGEIAFFPVEGTQAPPTSTPITEGKYQLAPRWSLMPGTYQVAVRSYRVSLDEGKKLPGSGLDRPPPPGGIEVKDQLLPEKFNTKSEIEKLVVKSGDAPMVQNYELKD